jgi:hypothetical protein
MDPKGGWYGEQYPFGCCWEPSGMRNFVCTRPLPKQRGITCDVTLQVALKKSPGLGVLNRLSFPSIIPPRFPLLPKVLLIFTCCTLKNCPIILYSSNTSLNGRHSHSLEAGT